MANARGDDEELRKAAEAAVDAAGGGGGGGGGGGKQKIALAIRVTKSNSIWAKSGRLNRHMSKPRVLSLTSKLRFLIFLGVNFWDL